MFRLDDSLEARRALIILDGDKPSREWAKSRAEGYEIVICCDGAAEFAHKAGIKVDAIVGDFDSLGLERSKEIAGLLNAKRIEYPEDKDMSDAQIAVDFAVADSCKKIDFIGALGGRTDHQMFNIGLLIYCVHNGTIGRILDEESEIYASCTHIFIPGRVGDWLSIFPLGVNVEVKCTDGLQYQLYDAKLSLGDTRSLSNVLVAEEAYVELSEGWALIIRTDKYSRNEINH